MRATPEISAIKKEINEEDTRNLRKFDIIVTLLCFNNL